MSEYLCKKGDEINNIEKRKRGHAIKEKAKNPCAFLYVKGDNFNATSYLYKNIKFYKLCSNPYFCEYKSLFPFKIIKKSCIVCGKITDLLNDNSKCFECKITEMANKKAEELLDKEWVI